MKISTRLHAILPKDTRIPYNGQATIINIHILKYYNHRAKEASSDANKVEFGISLKENNLEPEFWTEHPVLLAAQPQIS